MSVLRSELREQGFEPTGRESPFHEDGFLLENSHELVCDETAFIIRGNEENPERDSNRVAELSSEAVPRYEYSGRVILPGGHASVYEY